MPRTFLYILPLFLLAFTACEDILGVRNVDDPIINSGSSWVPATQGEKLFSNLEKIFSDRDTEYYLYNFFDEDSSENGLHFNFRASATTMAAYPGKFDTWSLQDEYTWFASLISIMPPDSSLSLTFKNLQLYSDYGDSMRFFAEYEIIARHRQENIPAFFSGSSFFTLVRDASNYWRILYWEDLSSEGAADWSLLKAQF